jgi:hypothetical protein
MSMLLAVGLLAVAGIGYLILQEMRNKQTPLGPSGSMMPSNTTLINDNGEAVLLDSQESAIEYLRRRLEDAGASDDDIDDYIEWLTDKPRSEEEVRKRIAAIIDI